AVRDRLPAPAMLPLAVARPDEARSQRDGVTAIDAVRTNGALESSTFPSRAWPEGDPFVKARTTVAIGAPSLDPMDSASERDFPSASLNAFTCSATDPHRCDGSRLHERLNHASNAAPRKGHRS